LFTADTPAYCCHVAAFALGCLDPTPPVRRLNRFCTDRFETAADSR